MVNKGSSNSKADRKEEEKERKREGGREGKEETEEKKQREKEREGRKRLMPAAEFDKADQTVVPEDSVTPLMPSLPTSVN